MSRTLRRPLALSRISLRSPVPGLASHAEPAWVRASRLRNGERYCARAPRTRIRLPTSSTSHSASMPSGAARRQVRASCSKVKSLIRPIPTASAPSSAAITHISCSSALPTMSWAISTAPTRPSAAHDWVTDTQSASLTRPDRRSRVSTPGAPGEATSTRAPHRRWKDPPGSPHTVSAPESRSCDTSVSALARSSPVTLDGFRCGADTSASDMSLQSAALAVDTATGNYICQPGNHTVSRWVDHPMKSPAMIAL